MASPPESELSLPLVSMKEVRKKVEGEKRPFGFSYSVGKSNHGSPRNTPKSNHGSPRNTPSSMFSKGTASGGPNKDWRSYSNTGTWGTMGPDNLRFGTSLGSQMFDASSGTTAFSRVPTNVKFLTETWALARPGTLFEVISQEVNQREAMGDDAMGPTNSLPQRESETDMDLGDSSRPRYITGYGGKNNTTKKKRTYYDCSMRGWLPGWDKVLREKEAERAKDECDEKGKTAWIFHGQRLHWWTLEFEDDELEFSYQCDTARASKNYVYRMCTFLGFYQFCSVLSLIFMVHLGWFQGFEQSDFWQGIRIRVLADIFDDWPRNHPFMPAFPAFFCLWYFSIHALIRWKWDWLVLHWQRVLFVWLLIDLAGHEAEIEFVDLHDPYEDCCGGEDLMGVLFGCVDFKRNLRIAAQFNHAVALFIAVNVFRLRFIFQVFVSLAVLLLRARREWSAGPLCRSSARDLHTAFVILLLSIGVSWFTEVMQRRQFMNASAVLEESLRTAWLLESVFPLPIVTELFRGNPFIVNKYDEVTILFADIVGFTQMSEGLTPSALVAFLDELFLFYDDVAEENEVEKIKTIGDCYMAAGGVPVSKESHAVDIARLGLQMIEIMVSGQIVDPTTGLPTRVRVGMHSGPAVAGVIGNTKWTYDIWGDAVNTASRMESHGVPMKVHCSERSAALLKGSFELSDRGVNYVKGKGDMRTFFVERESSAGLHRGESGLTHKSEDTHRPVKVRQSLRTARSERSRGGVLPEERSEKSRGSVPEEAGIVPERKGGPVIRREESFPADEPDTPGGHHDNSLESHDSPKTSNYLQFDSFRQAAHRAQVQKTVAEAVKASNQPGRTSVTASVGRAMMHNRKRLTNFPVQQADADPADGTPPTRSRSTPPATNRLDTSRRLSQPPGARDRFGLASSGHTRDSTRSGSSRSKSPSMHVGHEISAE